MGVSRPVVAFALLKECSEVLRTDLLGGISLLLKPLISDLGGKRFDAEELSQRISIAYGLAISPQALSDFLPRFISAGLVIEQKLSDTVSEVVYVDFEEPSLIHEHDETDFQFVFDKFLEFCKNHLSVVDLTMAEDQLIQALLNRLATFNFHAIEVKPDRTQRDLANGDVILGPTSKEDIEVEKIVSSNSKLDILVAAFVKHIAETDSNTLKLLSNVAEGALGAELVFDLQAPQVKSDLSKVTVIFDTPIVLSLLDLSDKQHCQYAEELLNQVIQSKATPAVFKHSIEEAEGVLLAVKNGALSGQAYGPTAARMRDRNYLIYFETMIGVIERRLIDRGLKVIEPTKLGAQQFFTDKQSEELTDRLRFHLVDRRLARERDALSVAETVRLRAGAHVPIEQIDLCKYIFVTPNLALQNQSRSYLTYQKLISHDEFSPIITDRYFAGLAWLLFGGHSDTSLPTAKLLANCAAALRARPDVIAKTKKFLERIDADKAAHFEALMTKERAAQYLTEITLGDSLLVTADNAEEIYEKVEAIAAVKVAHEKDIFYGQKLAESEIKLETLVEDLTKAKIAIEKLEVANAQKDSSLQYQEKNAELLIEKLKQETKQREEDESRIKDLSEKINFLDSLSQKATEEALRAKKTAIILALDKARYRLWLAKLSIVMGFALAALLVAYLDKFIVPTLAKENIDLGNYIVIFLQVMIFALSFSVLTDHLFSRSISRLVERKFNQSLFIYGYTSVGPEFEIDLSNFDLKSKHE